MTWGSTQAGLAAIAAHQPRDPPRRHTIRHTVSVQQTSADAPPVSPALQLAVQKLQAEPQPPVVLSSPGAGTSAGCLPGVSEESSQHLQCCSDHSRHKRLAAI